MSGPTFDLRLRRGAACAGLPRCFAPLTPTYSVRFAPFSPPGLFIARSTNVMDVLFNVPGNAAVPAGVTGFGAVFTDVDSVTSKRLLFFAPDGALLFERAVPAAQGDETQSFLGVSFDQGEVVGRVRIVSGNAAFGPDETDTLDLVAMDDFIYGEPVSTSGLFITRQSGTVFQNGSFDVVIGLEAPPAPLKSGRGTFDGLDVTRGLQACPNPGAIRRGGDTFRCPVPPGLLTEGEHVLQVVLTFADQTSRRNAVRWTVIGASQRQPRRGPSRGPECPCRAPGCPGCVAPVAHVPIAGIGRVVSCFARAHRPRGRGGSNSSEGDP